VIGEKLLTKLWDTIADKGIGGLLAPWQTLRTEKARTDARAREIVVLAEAERQAEAIKSGKAVLSSDGKEIKVIESPAQTSLDNPPLPVPEVKKIDLIEYAESQDRADSIQEKVNLTKALIHAEEVLIEDEAEPPVAEPEEDWVYRWKEYASKVSTEDLQQLWGAVLAGEVKEPGTYNLRTLEFLKNISKVEAKLIEKCAIHAVSGAVASNEKEILESQGMSFSEILNLQELGILQGAESIGMSIEFSSNEESSFQRALISNNRALVVTNEDPKKTLSLPSYGITGLGKQILSLGKFEANEEYLLSIGRKFIEQGYKVSIGDWHHVKGNQGWIKGLKEIDAENV